MDDPPLSNSIPHARDAVSEKPPNIPEIAPFKVHRSPLLGRWRTMYSLNFRRCRLQALLKNHASTSPDGTANGELAKG